MTIYELRDAIRQRLLGASDNSMSILIQSFGFKRGVPADADLVFDVLADLGEPEIVVARCQARYRDSNRSYMTISLGCTGGQHRSVYLAERLYRHYRKHYPEIHVRHRELQ